MKPKSARFPVPKSRYEMFSDAAVQNWKRIGREDAIRIAKARKGDDSAWFNVNRYTLKKVFPELGQRLLEICVKDWKNTPWESEPWYKPESGNAQLANPSPERGFFFGENDANP